MTPVILLATTVEWPFAARLAGGFAQMHARVEALAPKSHVLAKSRYVSAFHCYRPLAPEGALERAIRSAKPDLLIPCDDRALAQALHVWRRAEARRDDEISALIARSLGSPAVYARLVARTDFIADARADGILAPEMRAVDREDALEQALSAIGLPAVLKADGSRGGDGVVIVTTREEAREAWLKLCRSPSRARSLYRAIDRRDLHRVAEAIRPPKIRVGIQAYVEGMPATSTFAARKGEVLAALHFDVVVAPDVGRLISAVCNALPFPSPVFSLCRALSLPFLSALSDRISMQSELPLYSTPPRGSIRKCVKSVSALRYSRGGRVVACDA